MRNCISRTFCETEVTYTLLTNKNGRAVESEPQTATLNGKYTVAEASKVIEIGDAAGILIKSVKSNDTVYSMTIDKFRKLADVISKDGVKEAEPVEEQF